MPTLSPALSSWNAWLSAGILYAVILNQMVPEGETLASYLPKISAGDLPPVAPGPITYQAIGLAGVLCVIIAGWTTANPTIYRAGLAFQSLFPKMKRWKVTVIAGAIATFGAIFPALVMQLLDFVALYGLILMPMGAIIFIDFHVIPRLGLKSDYAEIAGITFSLPAGFTWIVTLIICLYLNLGSGVEIFFLGLPGWFIAAALYIVLSLIFQKKAKPSVA